VPEGGPPPPAPEEKPPEPFKVTTGMGFRLEFRIQNPNDGEKLNDQFVNDFNVEPRFSGKVTDIVAWTANFTVSGRTQDTAVQATFPPPPAGPPYIFEVRAMDLIGQLDFMDEFHIWAGRMLTPSDRTNFSGPWFIAPWSYPGVYVVPGSAAHPGGGFYIGPRGTEEVGREVGLTVWGDIMKGKFKYYLSALDLDDGSKSPLYSARLGYAFIGSEPGFYGSSTYYGSQDILAVGVAGQFQDQSSLLTTPDDPTTPQDEDETRELTEFNADLLAEFTAPGIGTFTGEGAIYLMDGPPSIFPMKNHWFVVGGYMLPEPIGIGKPQVVLRYQQAQNGDTDRQLKIMEASLAYVIKDYFAKIMVGYQRTDLDTFDADNDPNTPNQEVIGNAVQIGFQIQQ
jgi:hypothetical protein